MPAPTPQAYAQKFARMAPQTLYAKLPEDTRAFVADKARTLYLSQQELRELCQIANDLLMWKEDGLEQLWPAERVHRKQLLPRIRQRYSEIKQRPRDYSRFGAEDRPAAIKPNLVTRDKGQLGLGYCPVASERTRCCNLMTLDAVERCGFDCSYCSIQSFYHQNEVRFDSGFARKLAELQLDPEQVYHIGTGQSSDSLMWGNHNGNLAALCDFARANPNVILELKSKSRNIGWLRDNPFPPNLLCTWSLNPQTIIEHEEHQTASLAERIRSARRIADRNRLVGFHFHPMIWYQGYAEDYATIAARLVDQFDPHEVALVSIGTLTYTREVMRTIRQRDFNSKILQMPLEEVAGKYAYPEQIKIEMFRGLYQAFEPWHDRVFFYLCMEPEALWQPVFGNPGYTNNRQFEVAMKGAYMDKIERVRATEAGPAEIGMRVQPTISN